MSSENRADKHGHLVKRCPECLEYMPLDAKNCPACKKKVGDVLPHGMAEKPTNWLSYLTMIVAIVALGAYMYWLFFLNE